MKFTMSLAGFTALLPLASARCYKGGAPWPQNHAGVISAITAASAYYN